MQPATANETDPRGCKAAGSYAPKRPGGQADTLCFAQGAGAIASKNAAWIRPCGPKPAATRRRPYVQRSMGPRRSNAMSAARPEAEIPACAMPGVDRVSSSSGDKAIPHGLPKRRYCELVVAADAGFFRTPWRCPIATDFTSASRELFEFCPMPRSTMHRNWSGRPRPSSK
jgi:hypothetical protein